MIPILLYALETLYLKEDNARRPDAFQTRCICKMPSIKWTHKRSNDEIQNITNQTSVQQMLRTRRLSYFGHICEMKDSRLPNVIMKWDPGLKKPPGRLRQRWLDLIKRYLSETTHWVDTTH